jgi:hypothetical protein
MKAREAVIAYTPSDWTGSYEATIGKVEVGLYLPGHVQWSDRYAFVVGAAFPSIRELRGSDAIAQLFVDFHTAVVRDGIDPQVAHQAFLVIDEYAESIAPDIEGARGRRLE